MELQNYLDVETYFLILVNFYAPFLRIRGGDFDLALTVHPSKNFVAKVEKWVHLCPMVTFLVIYLLTIIMLLCKRAVIVTNNSSVKDHILFYFHQHFENNDVTLADFQAVPTFPFFYRPTSSYFFCCFFLDKISPTFCPTFFRDDDNFHTTR